MTKKVWVLIDNRVGSATQARGVANALGFEVEEKQIEYTPISRLPNFLKTRSLMGVKSSSKKALKGPYPDLVISASRRTAMVACWIKKRSKGQTKIVQLMHPGNFAIKDFDMLFVPEHDKKKKSTKNMIYIVGATHGFTPTRLTKEREEWMQKFAHLPKPLTAVMVGGKTGGVEFSAENATAFGKEIRRIKDVIGGSILITTSKRTGEKAQACILKEIEEIPSYQYLWGNKDTNPYAGFLACADQIIATGDSVSMCSEACGTGKPVFIFTGKNWISNKLNRFIESLYQNGYAINISHPAALTFYPKAALNNLEFITKHIKKMFK